MLLIHSYVKHNTKTITKLFMMVFLYMANKTLRSISLLNPSVVMSPLCLLYTGFGTAVHGRSPTLFQPSSTSRPTVTSLQMGTTWYPAVMALEARAVKPR